MFGYVQECVFCVRVMQVGVDNVQLLCRWVSGYCAAVMQVESGYCKVQVFCRWAEVDIVLCR